MSNYLTSWFYLIQILAVAALAGLEIDVAKNYKHHEDNLKPDFRAKFASGKIPALETVEGFTIFETSAIARYGESWIPISPFHDDYIKLSLS